VQARAERVVLARDVYQIAQLLIEFLTARAQRVHLMFDQRHRAAADLVLERELAEQIGVARKEVGLVFQVAQNCFSQVSSFGQFVGTSSPPSFGLIAPRDLSTLQTPSLSDRHPHRFPSPAHATRSGPPTRLTSTVASSKPPWRPETTRRRRRCHRRASRHPTLEHPQSNMTAVQDLHKPRIYPAWETGMAFDQGPCVTTGATSTSDTICTACGLPMITR